MPKHRRSEVEPSLASLASLGARAEPAEFWPEAVGYDCEAARASLAAALEDHSWQESQDWRDWGPPPALHPDHPSAPVPRVQIRPDDPSGHRPAYPARSAPDSSSLWMAGQVLTLADNRAAQIAQEAQDYALAICEAAEREAAAITHGAATWAEAITQQATSHAAGIREAAEREAAALRARLCSVPGELSQVVTAYVSESLAAPVMPPTAPVFPGGMPALPGPGSAPPEPGAARPDTSAVRPRARPGADPEARPGRPKTTPARKTQKRPRQRQAMRIATGATATLLLFSMIAGAAEIGLHGFNFFVFREAGVGQTSGNETDQQFLARQHAAHQSAPPKGRHHKKPQQTLEVHHN